MDYRTSGASADALASLSGTEVRTRCRICDTRSWALIGRDAETDRIYAICYRCGGDWQVA